MPAAVLLVATSLVVMVALLAGVTWFEQRVLSPKSIIVHTARCRSNKVEHVERLVRMEAERLLAAEDLATHG
jgi:maleate cis-trans isomerase